MKKLNREQEKDMMVDLDRFRDDFMWISDNYDVLLKIYPEETIMVYKKIVVGHDKNWVKLVEDMRKKGDFDPAFCASEYITANPPSVLTSIWRI